MNYEFIKIWDSLKNLQDADAIIIDKNVLKHHDCLASLVAENILILDQPESQKNWQGLESVLLFFYRLSLNKDSSVFVVGGGALLDLGGLAASLYKRGLILHFVPTTILAMVDASIGGKNAINFQGIKNLIGHFYQPVSVIYYPNFLNTLPCIEVLSGFAECLKLGIISDYVLWKSLDMQSFAIDKIINCAKKKWDIVQQDLYDRGIRHILNFGHTIGHALESIYSLPHGIAIAYGMLLESQLSHSLGYLDSKSLEEIVVKISKIYGNLPSFDPSSLVDKMMHDKKNGVKGIGIHALQNIGEPPKLIEINETSLKRNLEQLWILS